jgi:adenine-specific DNA methylase
MEESRARNEEYGKWIILKKQGAEMVLQTEQAMFSDDGKENHEHKNAIMTMQLNEVPSLLP